MSVYKIDKTKNLVYIAILLALTETLCLTPLGMINLPFVSITIAHIPILVAAILLNLSSAILISFVFGLTTLFLAATQSRNLLDPFFINPCVSILPRLLIPIVTFYLNIMFKKIFKKKIITYSIAVIAGNLTNTFGVYFFIYLFYAKEKLSNNKTILQTILASIAFSTLWKCIAIVIITVPILITLENLNIKTKK
jgi:uncharacterized membrane protein